MARMAAAATQTQRQSMPLGEYISIVRLAPSATRNERRRYVAIRGFFDGSGKFDARSKVEPQPHRAITLAGLSASEVVWPDFESAWLDALRGLGFRKWRSSTMQEILAPEFFERAAIRLLEIISGFRDRQMVWYRSTVLLADYYRARQEHPDLMPAEALCINGCIGNLAFPTLDDVPAIIYFDRDEPFKGLIEVVWRKRRKMFDRDWSHQIEDILPTHSDKCGIQAADLLAWLSNKNEELNRQVDAPADQRQIVMELSLRAFFSTYARGMVYDYEKIVATYQRRQNQ
jgi:hypothetical protein